MAATAQSLIQPCGLTVPHCRGSNANGISGEFTLMGSVKVFLARAFVLEALATPTANTKACMVERLVRPWNVGVSIVADPPPSIYEQVTGLSFTLSNAHFIIYEYNF